MPSFLYNVFVIKLWSSLVSKKLMCLFDTASLKLFNAESILIPFKLHFYERTISTLISCQRFWQFHVNL